MKSTTARSVAAYGLTAASWTRSSIGRIPSSHPVSYTHLRVAKAARAQQDARRRTELVLQQYKSIWKLQATDLSASFEDRDAYIGRYRQIKASGLPQYERKFLDVLNSFSQDQITAISSEIRNAFREVRDRLVPVNRSLLLSEYSSAIHLQIEVKEHRSPRVNEFLADLKEITRGSWEEDDLETAERRYARTAVIMKRLGSNDRSDQTWRMACLNTPDHMKFIAKEVAGDGAVVDVHSNDGGLSGGQKQKLVFFCLAAALRYQLSDEDQPIPSYGTIILDEAFDKSDRHFAEEALGIFEAFGFHMVLATPGKLLQTAEDHIGAMVMVTCLDGKQDVYKRQPHGFTKRQNSKENSEMGRTDISEHGKRRRCFDCYGEKSRIIIGFMITLSISHYYCLPVPERPQLGFLFAIY